LAAGSADHSISLWNTRTATQLAVLKDHKDAIVGLAFSPEGRVFASRSNDLTIKFWDVKTYQKSLTIDTRLATGGIAISPDGLYVAGGDADEKLNASLNVWSIKDGSNQFTVKGSTAPISAVAYSLDGAYLAASNTDGAVTIWDKATNKPRQPMF